MGANRTTQEIYMARHCPVCGQSLPTGLDEHTIEQRLRKLAAPALSEERRTVEREFNDRFERQRERLKKEAEKGVQQRLLAAEKRAAEVERLRNRDREWFEKQTDKQAQQATKQARKEAQVDIEKIETARQKDRAHFEMDRQKFQQQLDAMSRRLEKKTGEQL